MKVAFLADNQVDERSRLEEHDRVMDFIAEDARARGCEVVLHGGDVYERRSTARERASIHAWLDKVTSFAQVVIAGGNHEAPGEVTELRRDAVYRDGVLLSKREVYALERPETVIVSNAARTEHLYVDVLPWPRRANLHAWAGTLSGPSGRIWSREEIEAAAGDALRAVLRGLGAGYYFVSQAPRAPRVLLAHAMVRGARQGPDQPLLGCDFELGLEDLYLANAHVNLLGHIHMPQDWSEFVDPLVVPTIYAGSPRRTAYAAGELEPKGYVVLEFDGPRLVKWERVPTPATPMLLLEAEWNAELGAFASAEAVARGDAGILDPLPDLKGAEVRLRYEVDAVAREEAGRGAAVLRDLLLAEGALEVKVEEVVRPLTRARAPEVAAASTLAEKLRAYWRAKGMDLGAREPRILEGLALLEQEVAA
jgi:DNA repair exonuclease SbcCD nuclease subunit